MEMDVRIKHVLEHTRLIRAPKQELATFGSSVIDYYVVTELLGNVCVVRDGKVIAERPRIVTPSYLINIEGFSEQARKYLGMMERQHPDEPGIFYRYRNEPKGMNVVSEPLEQVLDNLKSRVDQEGATLSTIIKGVEELWDVSLLMFIYEVTKRSVRGNIEELSSRGLLDTDGRGVPLGARKQIEELFEMVSHDLTRAPELVVELTRWGLFSEYEDRFFSLFRKT